MSDVFLQKKEEDAYVIENTSPPKENQSEKNCFLPNYMSISFENKNIERYELTKRV